MRPEDVYALTGVSDPRVRPGGEEVAYVVWSIDRDENEYRQSIWLARTDGSEPPRRLTTGKNDSQPRWSPDGQRLAFVSKRGEGDKKPGQLYVMPLGGGEAQRLTELKEDVGEVAWSPRRHADRVLGARARPGLHLVEGREGGRGRQAAGAAPVQAAAVQARQRRLDRRPAAAHLRRPRRRLGGGEAAHRRRLRGLGSAVDAGRVEQIAFSSARGEHWDIEPLGDLYLVPADGRRAEATDAGRQHPRDAGLLADGSLVACFWAPGAFDFPRHTQVAVVDAETGENRRVLTASLDRQCSPYPPMREPIWDGDSIVFAVEDAGNIHLYRVSPRRRRAGARCRRRDRPLRLRRARRRGRPHRFDGAEPDRAVRRRQAADGHRPRVRRRPRARHARAVHRSLGGRHGGRLPGSSGRPGWRRESATRCC